MIRAWREHLSLTQAQVAKRAGMAQAAVARIERGESKPRTATLAKLSAAAVLNMKINLWWRHNLIAKTG